MSTTVFNIDLSAGTIDVGWQGYTVAIVLPAATLSAATGDQASVTLFLRTFSSGDTLTAYIGQAAGSGDAYDFAGNQVQLLWSGSGTLTGSDLTDSTYASDFVTLGETYDETKNYLVAVQFVGGLVDGRYVDGVGGGGNYYKLGAEASTTDKTGYTLENGVTNRAQHVTKLEIQASAGVVLSPAIVTSSIARKIAVFGY